MNPNDPEWLLKRIKIADKIISYDEYQQQCRYCKCWHEFYYNPEFECPKCLTLYCEHCHPSLHFTFSPKDICRPCKL